jgi:ABC-type Na+ efflux pump permease subunit
MREGKLILASNFDKERANEATGVETYDRVATPASASSPEDKLLGNWKVDVSLADQNVDYGLRIAKADGKLDVTLISPRSGEHKAKSATYKADELVMEFDRQYQGNSVTLTYRGKLKGDELSGTVTAKGFEDQYNGKWKAKKN